MTNIERIRKMTAEDLADAMLLLLDEGNPCDFCAEKWNTCCEVCENGIKKWLESEAEE